MLYEPLISVIIPIYNAEKYLNETIDSVINQTYKKTEILLINHNSTDHCRDIIDSYIARDKRISKVELDVNKGGPAFPRNIGVDKSEGEYIAFLDSDDVWSPDKLEKQLDFMLVNEVNFTSSDCVLINYKSQLIKLSVISSLFNKLVHKKKLTDLIKNNFILTSSVLIQKSLLLRFSEEKNYISVEDFDMWLKVFIMGESRYKYQNDKLLKYRVVDESASNRSNILRQELKRNLILSSFLIDHEEYLFHWYNRTFFHVLRKHLKKTLISRK